MRSIAVPLLLGLALLASGCSGPSKADRAEEEALRARVDKLEREDAAERQRMAGEIADLRRELEGLRQELDGQPQPAPPNGEPRPEKKSPRQALKQGFHDMVSGARRTLDRLGRELDESLARKKGEGARPAPAPAPPKPETPETPAGAGTQI